jgi:hypothetical protein
METKSVEMREKGNGENTTRIVTGTADIAAVTLTVATGEAVTYSERGN